MTQKFFEAIAAWHSRGSYETRGMIESLAGVAVLIPLSVCGIAVGIKFGRFIGAW